MAGRKFVENKAILKKEYLNFENRMFFIKFTCTAFLGTYLSKLKSLQQKFLS